MDNVQENITESPNVRDLVNGRATDAGMGKGKRKPVGITCPQCIGTKREGRVFASERALVSHIGQMHKRSAKARGAQLVKARAALQAKRDTGTLKRKAAGYTCAECEGEAALREYKSEAALRMHVLRAHRMTKADRKRAAKKALQTKARKELEATAALAGDVSREAVATVEAKVDGRGKYKRKPKDSTSGPGLNTAGIFTNVSPIATLDDALHYIELKREWMGEVIADFKKFASRR